MKLKTVLIKSAISMLSLLASLPPFLQPQIVTLLESKGTPPDLLQMLRGKFVEDVEKYIYTRNSSGNAETPVSSVSFQNEAEFNLISLSFQLLEVHRQI